MENETFVAAGRAPVNRFFGAITIILSLFGCLALGLLIAFSIFLSRARAQSELARAYEEQARAAQAYQANLVSAVPTQNSQYQPQPPQYSIPYPTPYGTIPPAMMGSPVNSLPTPSPIPQTTERILTSALDAEVQRLAIELRSANSEKRELLNQELAGEGRMPACPAGHNFDLLEVFEFLWSDVHLLKKDVAGFLANAA